MKISITDPHSYHITTHFFGNINRKTQEKIIDGLRKIRITKFNVTLARPGYFPEEKPNSARVLFLGTENGFEKFQQLYDEISKQLVGIRYKRKENFIPHLTVARIRKGDPSELIQKWLQFEFAEEFKVDHLNFYKSELLPDGAKHTVLFSKELD